MLFGFASWYVQRPHVRCKTSVSSTAAAAVRAACLHICVDRATVSTTIIATDSYTGLCMVYLHRYFNNRYIVLGPGRSHSCNLLDALCTFVKAFHSQLVGPTRIAESLLKPFLVGQRPSGHWHYPSPLPQSYYGHGNGFSIRESCFAIP